MINWNLLNEKEVERCEDNHTFRRFGGKKKEVSTKTISCTHLLRSALLYYTICLT